MRGGARRLLAARLDVLAAIRDWCCPDQGYPVGIVFKALVDAILDDDNETVDGLMEGCCKVTRADCGCGVALVRANGRSPLLQFGKEPSTERGPDEGGSPTLFVYEEHSIVFLVAAVLERTVGERMEIARERVRRIEEMFSDVHWSVGVAALRGDAAYRVESIGGGV